MRAAAEDDEQRDEFVGREPGDFRGDAGQVADVRERELRVGGPARRPGEFVGARATGGADAIERPARPRDEVGVARAGGPVAPGSVPGAQAALRPVPSARSRNASRSARARSASARLRSGPRRRASASGGKRP